LLDRSGNGYKCINNGASFADNKIGLSKDGLSRKGICFLDDQYIYIDDESNIDKLDKLELGNENMTEFLISFFIKPSNSKAGTRTLFNKASELDMGTPMIYYSTLSERIKFGVVTNSSELEFKWSKGTVGKLH